MEIITHTSNHQTVAEIKGEAIYLKGIEDGMDLIGNSYYQGYDLVILHARNITPAFFDLSTQLAGEILQKFVNYRMRVAIIGDWTGITSKSLRDFIRESNAGRQVYFTGSIDHALEKLTQ
ncbi:DUF4180 domain-containing protein [Niabella sp.]|uniref:DUF4180 domain-containing protein n=1 Tax=Niabella sp. TaxID=1962976 RepID=UPI002601E41E|nr:DUF4180 domain-containing protein [Niabella sp.]